MLGLIWNPVTFIRGLLIRSPDTDTVDMCEGNMTLDALGIGDASVSGAMVSMGRMIVGNLFMAWLGLVVSNFK